jgi:hypothetical protein
VINGGGGFDRSIYNGDGKTTAGINVHLAAGTVTGDASIGTDTLMSVEAIRGTDFADTFDATGFTATSTNAGSGGVIASGAAINEFEGMGGNDTITGNGATRVSYDNATAGVTVTLGVNGSAPPPAMPRSEPTRSSAVSSASAAPTLPTRSQATAESTPSKARAATTP